MTAFKPKDLIAQRLLSYLLFEHPRSEDGKLPPAAFFAETFSVSIVTIREILKSMEGIGILSMEHGRGIFLNHGDTIFSELFETRLLIEGHCARLAAARIAAASDEASAEHLKEYVDLLAQAVESSNMELYTDADFDFHMEVAVLSGNLVLERTLRNIRTFLYVQQKQTNKALLKSREQSLTEHRAILDALLSGDPDRAEDAMKDHLNRTRELWNRA